MNHTTDFDLHGLVGIRVLNAEPRDTAAIRRQLGHVDAVLDRSPDITIRFVDQLPAHGRVRFLGLDEAGFTDDAFLVLRGKHKSRARVQIPFDRVGHPCEIVCERGLASVPLLIPIVNLSVLAKGALPLHASGFTYRDTGFLATGWSKGGKTETLLAFMAEGATYVGDEWVHIGADGRRMFGIPEPIRVWDWHLESLPRFRRSLSRSDRARLRALGTILGGLDLLGRNGTNGNRVRRTLARLRPLLQKQRCVDIRPERIFGPKACRSEGNLDKVLFVVSHETQDVDVRRVDASEIAARMVFSLQEEQVRFMSYYHKFRFAFPDRKNDIVENSEALQRQALERALAGKESYAVHHPYPMPLPVLFDAVVKHCL